MSTVLIIVIAVIVVAILMWVTFKLFAMEQSLGSPATPFAQGRILPPEPRLQLAPGFGVKTDDGQEHDLSYEAKTDHVPQPQSEYLTVRDEWRRELEDYGWADQQAGTVRVPVDKAIQLYLQRQRAKQQAQESQK